MPRISLANYMFYYTVSAGKSAMPYIVQPQNQSQYCHQRGRQRRSRCHRQNELHIYSRKPRENCPTPDFTCPKHRLIFKIPKGMTKPNDTSNQIFADSLQEYQSVTFCLLLKIYKPGQLGRSIVSSVHTITVGVSG